MSNNSDVDLYVDDDFVLLQTNLNDHDIIAEQEQESQSDATLTLVTLQRSQRQTRKPARYRNSSTKGIHTDLLSFK